MLDRKTEELLNLLILSHFCQSQQRFDQIQALPNKRKKQTDKPPSKLQVVCLQDPGFKHVVASTARLQKVTPTASNLKLQLLSNPVKPTRIFLPMRSNFYFLKDRNKIKPI